MKRLSILLCALAAALAFLGPVTWADVHVAVGSEVELGTPINQNYPGTDGARTLTDSATGSLTLGDGTWMGFEGLDLEATVQLARETHVTSLAADFLQVTGPAVFLPVSVDFAVAENGTNFRTIATVEPQTELRAPGPVIERIAVDGLDLNVRAVRIRVANRGRVPAWHGSTALCWTFISEILVNPGEEPRSPWTDLAGYEFGTSRWCLAVIEEQLRTASSATPGMLADLCARLEAVLATADAAVAAREFCCRQLAMFGSEANLPALAEALQDPALTEAAAAAMVQIGGDLAGAELMRALDTVPAGRATTVVRALGQLRPPGAVDRLARYLPGADPGMAVEAARALGAMGSPGAAAALRNVAMAPIRAEVRPELLDACLRCAHDLFKGGNNTEARRMYAHVAEQAKATSIGMAAIGGLVLCGQPGAKTELLNGLNSPETAIRSTAASLILRVAELHGGALFSNSFEQLPVSSRVLLLNRVGTNYSSGTISLVRSGIESTETAVRTAAIRAAGRLGDQAAVTLIVPALSSPDTDEREAAAQALSRARGEDVDPAILNAARDADGVARTRLVEIMGERGYGDATPEMLLWATTGSIPELRKAAWNAMARAGRSEDLAGMVEALVTIKAGADSAAAVTAVAQAAKRSSATEAVQLCLEQLPGAPVPVGRAGLLTLLGKLAQPAGLPALETALNDAHPEVRVAAVKALGSWPDDAPIRSLLAASAGDDERTAILGLRAALACISRGIDLRPPVGTAGLLTQALARARRDPERVLVLGCAGEWAHPAALPLAVGGLDEPGVRVAAEHAFLRIAANAWTDEPVRVKELLIAISADGASDETRARAAELIADYPSQDLCRAIADSAWGQLFNGSDLSGWRVVNADDTAWEAADGILTAREGGGGWLAAAEERSNYLIELEFQLAEGGNSGFFLRPPLEGNPAFEGIEVQILDDDAPQYAGLEASQYCGSLYGIAAATPGVARPAGEWQRLRVLCAGRLAAVWLNGVEVARADLDEHADKAGRIPGIQRTSGFPGLQNEHGTNRFRNLRIKDLAQQ